MVQELEFYFYCQLFRDQLQYIQSNLIRYCPNHLLFEKMDNFDLSNEGIIAFLF